MDGIATKGFQFLSGRSDRLAQLGHVSLIDGKNNAAVGLQAGTSVKNGSNNVFFGSMSGASAIANGSTFLGAATGQFASRVKDSCFIGYRAGQYANRVDASVCVGPSAGQKMSRANCNTVIGFRAGAELTSGSRNTIVGSLAALSQYNGSDNVCIGHQAGYQNRVGSNNCYIGTNSGFTAVNGLENVCVGVESGQKLTRGTQNVLLGYAAGANIANASNCIAIGTRAMEFFFDGDTNTCLGTQTAQHFSGINNTILGGYSTANASGNYNTIIGSRSMNRASRERVNLSNCVIVGENIQFDIPIRKVVANAAALDLVPDAQDPGNVTTLTLTNADSAEGDNTRAYLEINVVPVGDPVLVRNRYFALGTDTDPVAFDTSEPGTYTVRWGSAPSETLDLLDPIPVHLELEISETDITIQLTSYGDLVYEDTLDKTDTMWVALEQTFEDPPAITLKVRTTVGNWDIDETFDTLALPGAVIDIDSIPSIAGNAVTVFVTSDLAHVVPGMAIQVLGASVSAFNGVWRIRSLGTPVNGRTPLTFVVDTAPTLSTSVDLSTTQILASRVVTRRNVVGTMVGNTVRLELPEIAGMLVSDPSSVVAYVDGNVTPVTVLDMYAGSITIPGTSPTIGTFSIGSFEPLVVGFDVDADGDAKSVADFSVTYAQRSDKGVQTAELVGPSASDGHVHRGAGSIGQMDANIARGELTFVDGASYADYTIGSANSNVSVHVTFTLTNDGTFGIEWLNAYAFRCSLGSNSSTFGAALQYTGVGTAPARELANVTSDTVSASGTVLLKTNPGHTPTLPIQLGTSGSPVTVTLDIHHQLRLREIEVTANVASGSTFNELTFAIERAFPVSSASSIVSLFATKPARASGLTIRNTNYQLYPTFSDCIFLGSNFTVGSNQDARLDQKANVFVAAIGNVPMFKGTLEDFAFFSNSVTINELALNGNLTANADVAIQGSLDVHGPVDIQDTVHIADDVTLDADLDVSGNVTIQEFLDTLADAHIGGDVDVDGDATLGGNVTIDGTLTVAGHTTCDDSVTVTGTLDVAGATRIDDALTVTGHTVLHTATAGGDVVVQGDVTVAGDVTVTQGVTTDSVTLKTGSSTATLDVNDAFRGNLKIGGQAVGGWDGIRFSSSGMILAFRSAEAGFYHETDGWKLYIDGSENLYVSGNMVAYHSFSDKRLKANLRPVDSGAVLDALPAYEFEWKATGAREIGLLAQDVKTVMPWAVHQPREHLVVDYAKLVPVLVDAVSTLRARVDALEKQISGISA